MGQIDLSEFTPIPGYEDRYLISKDGVIWSTYRNKPVKRQVRLGYLKCHLSVDGVKRYRPISRLLLLTFRPVPNSHKLQVRHMDGNRLNNSLSNLEWGTSQQNHDDMVRHGTATWGSKDKMAKLAEEQVLEIRNRWIPKSSEHGILKIAKDYGVNHVTIWHIVQRDTWRHI